MSIKLKSRMFKIFSSLAVIFSREKFNNLRFANKLTLLLAPGIIAFIGLPIWGAYGNAVNGNIDRQLEHLSYLRGDAMSSALIAGQYGSAIENEIKDTANYKHLHLKAVLKTITKSIPAIAKDAATLEKPLLEIIEQINIILTTTAAPDEGVNDEAELLGDMVTELNQKISLQAKKLTILKKEVHERYNLWTIIIISLGVMMFIAVLTVMKRVVLTPLNYANILASDLAKGDLTHRVEYSSKDEFGELISSLNIMASNLSELVKKVQHSGIQVSTSSTEIASTAKQQEVTMTEQAATTNEISTAASEISATVKQLVETMDDVTTVAESTSAEAANSEIALGSMEKTMQQMMDATLNVSSELSVLNEKAENINNVVTIITNVADQTNLLSLNASIEAEKAGEYGIGFTVLATEIRRLADQTAVAIWDIEKMVKAIQSAVSASVIGMDKFTDDVHKGVKEVHNVGTQLSKIITKVQNLMPSFESVHDGMQNQAQGAQQITDSISQLNEGTQQTVESLRLSNSTIRKLNDSAEELQEGVTKFKI